MSVRRQESARVAWWAGALVVLLGAGCVKGVGDPCSQHAECLPGLACSAAKCATCGDGQACLPVDLVVRSCDPAASPLDGVTTLRLTITGDNLTPIVQTVGVTEKQASMPKVPFGTHRRVVVEGLEAADNPVPKSRGESGLFDVKADQPTTSVTVYLRRVQQFSGANGRFKPDVCVQLGQPRAGHSSTLLPDGRVLIAGGYTVDGTGNKTFLKSVELYDPKSGQFTALGTSLTLARAGHTASTLPSGKVLLAGGAGLINSKESGLATAELFDPVSQRFQFIPMKKPRMRHAAAVLPNGVVLLTGGTEKAEDRYPTDRTEFYNPNTSTFTEGPHMKSIRADHTSVAVDGDRVFVIGGVDGEQPLDSVDVFHYLGGAFVLVQDSTYQLASGRPNPLALAMDAGGGKQGVLVVGAWVSGGQSAKDAWDWLVEPGQADIGRDALSLPTPRREACAAAIEGGVVAVGGRKPDGTLLQTADSYVIGTTGKLVSGKAGSLSSPRAHVACTTLFDGSVLVTGGEGVDGVSSAAEIYEPLP